MKQAKLANKDDIVDFVKKTCFDEKLVNTTNKVTSNKTKTCSNRKGTKWIIRKI